MTQLGGDHRALASLRPAGSGATGGYGPAGSEEDDDCLDGSPLAVTASWRSGGGGGNFNGSHPVPPHHANGAHLHDRA